jgi:tetratricopeptide (TPR) repeat protein
MHRIALVMIARDEARCIERALLSAKPWVDEMVVLDTGSDDGTAATAARCGAQVSRFQWVQDFAAARNAALACTSASWRLVLDADEWIAGGADCLAALRTTPPSFIGQITVDSAFDAAAGAVHQAPSWLPRMLPSGVVYAGRIHEQPASSLPRQRLPLVIGHDGYRDAQMHAKRGRNEQLLQLALAADPHDAYLRYQLGKDLELRGRFAAAAACYLQAHAEAPPPAAWRHDLVLRLLFSLKKLGRFAQALELAEREMPQWAASPDFFFALGDMLLEWAAAEPARAGALLPLIESNWLHCIEIGENPLLPDSVRGRGSFLAAHNLAAFHSSLGRANEARLWRDRAAAWRADAECTAMN